MSEKIISVDLDVKETIKGVIDDLEQCDCNLVTEFYLTQSIERLKILKKRMRVFVKPKKDSKTFSIRVNSEDSMETVQNKLKRIELKIKEYKGDKTESI